VHIASARVVDLSLSADIFYDCAKAKAAAASASATQEAVSQFAAPEPERIMIKAYMRALINLLSLSSAAQ
jgi:hypothetical protein